VLGRMTRELNVRGADLPNFRQWPRSRDIREGAELLQSLNATDRKMSAVTVWGREIISQVTSFVWVS
jgi:hypothetical protein